MKRQGCEQAGGAGDADASGAPVMWQGKERLALWSFGPSERLRRRAWSTSPPQQPLQHTALRASPLQNTNSPSSPLATQKNPPQHDIPAAEFVVETLEAEPLRTQAAKYEAADVLVQMHGAALGNVFFLPRGAVYLDVVPELNEDKHAWAYFMLRDYAALAINPIALPPQRVELMEYTINKTMRGHLNTLTEEQRRGCEGVVGKQECGWGFGGRWTGTASSGCFQTASVRGCGAAAVAQFALPPPFADRQHNPQTVHLSPRLPCHATHATHSSLLPLPFPPSQNENARPHTHRIAGGNCLRSTSVPSPARCSGTSTPSA